MKATVGFPIVGGKQMLDSKKGVESFGLSPFTLTEKKNRWTGAWTRYNIILTVPSISAVLDDPPETETNYFVLDSLNTTWKLHDAVPYWSKPGFPTKAPRCIINTGSFSAGILTGDGDPGNLPFPTLTPISEEQQAMIVSLSFGRHIKSALPVREILNTSPSFTITGLERYVEPEDFIGGELMVFDLRNRAYNAYQGSAVPFPSTNWTITLDELVDNYAPQYGKLRFVFAQFSDDNSADDPGGTKEATFAAAMSASGIDHSFHTIDTTVPDGGIAEARQLMLDEAATFFT